uniref:Uncharacterized protein n=1 Tax=Lepeophtheirus salmonis TaxID=72036 RepID=A0A0K2UW87_LEPSM
MPYQLLVKISNKASHINVLSNKDSRYSSKVYLINYLSTMRLNYILNSPLSLSNAKSFLLGFCL